MDGLEKIFGPQVSIGNLLAGRHVSDDEFMADDSPWVICYVDPATYQGIPALLDPITPEQQAAAAEYRKAGN